MKYGFQEKNNVKSFFVTLNKKTSTSKLRFFLNVRVKGLEPPSREALDPKSSVSTNFTTPAKGRQI